MLAVKLSQLGLGVAPEPGADGSLLCACTLQTGLKASDGSKVVVGCMAMVRHEQGASARVVVRASSQHVSPCLAATIARLLSSR